MTSSALPLLEVCGVSHVYPRRRGAFGQAAATHSLCNISFSIATDCKVALVGGSGSGKSTLAKCIVLMEKPTAGEIRFEDNDIRAFRGKELSQFRQQVQLIYQDSATSFNPRFTALEIVSEPLSIQGGVAGRKIRERALEQMARVGLPERLGAHGPLELSGGQRQRLAIARALILRPKLLIFDEALAGLDLLVQRRIVELLCEVQQNISLTYLFITHDLTLAGVLADEIIVMRDGEIVEQGRPPELLTLPCHEYTRRLVSAANLFDFEIAKAMD
jgi:peptide/nickel transport system ATP-binding protein